MPAHSADLTTAHWAISAGQRVIIVDSVDIYVEVCFGIDIMYKNEFVASPPV